MYPRSAYKAMRRLGESARGCDTAVGADHHLSPDAELTHLISSVYLREA